MAPLVAPLVIPLVTALVAPLAPEPALLNAAERRNLGRNHSLVDANPDQIISHQE